MLNLEYYKSDFDLDNMPAPNVLQKYLNMLTKNGDTWRSTDKSWETILASKDRLLARDIERSANRTILDQKILNRIQTVVLDKSGSNRGRRDLSTPRRANVSGPARGKGQGKGNGTWLQEQTWTRMGA